MTASDYQISFPYGATSAPYSTAHPHRGDDRPCPEGTPVVISGVTIGLTGHTGLATGPHLHTQEWLNDYADTRKPQNAFWGGTVTDTGTLSEFGNFVTIQTADGWHDTYCHLSQINVTKGQTIKGGMFMVDENLLFNYYRYLLGRAPDPAGKKSFLGQPADVVFQELVLSDEYKRHQAEITNGDFVPVADQLYKKK